MSRCLRDNFQTKLHNHAMKNGDKKSIEDHLKHIDILDQDAQDKYH